MNYTIYNDFISIVNLLNYKYKNKIPLDVVIAYLKEIYPVGKAFIKTNISYILKIKLDKKQKYIKRKYYKKFILKNELGETKFAIIEALYFLYKKNIKKINRKKLYRFLLYNYQINNISFEEFKNNLFALKICKKNIIISKKQLKKLIKYYNLDESKIYNDTYILKV